MNEIPAADNDSAEALISEVADEFLERWERGEQPEVEEYARRYPHLAEALRQVLPALPLLRHSGAALMDPSAAWQPDVPLGDYRLVREVGRGGMGVVYEAVQLSLGRRVALKVLPFAAALDAKQLQRFKNEAQAAAHLEHPHIVPVYAVGCERGVHFYAMKLIDGHTLAAVIHELRRLCHEQTPVAPAAVSAASALAEELVSGRWTPSKGSPSAGPPTGPYVPSPAEPSALTATPPVAALSTERSATSPAFFRTVAHLGIQAAEALEHAHQLGIIHRDIKPANLLVDASGGLWVTDFGLARLGTDTGLTMSGDLLGTLRYMSPEQALAQRGAVDARTDVYSLGVTLYELLALQPAYDGRNREEVLRQIALEEPRRLSRAIPVELDTIVLKAMAKNPDERYAAAQELADDLRRFLEDKPIKARRPSLRQRARKWARRHRTVVRAAAVVLALAVVALAVSTVLIWTAKEDLHQALERERQNAYYQRIALAEREWATNNLPRMLQLLDECPDDLRGWEWHYLNRLRFQGLAPLRHEVNVLSAAWSPNGRWIASAGGGGFVRIWDARTGHELQHFQAHDDNIYQVAFSTDGRYLASASWDGTVKLWDTETWQPLRYLRGQSGKFWALAFSPDGQLLAGGSGPNPPLDGMVHVWETATGRERLRLMEGLGAIYALAFSPDGRYLAGGGADRLVRIWDVQTGRETRALSGHNWRVWGVAFSPDGHRLASVAGGSSQYPHQAVKVWNVRTGQELLALSGHVGGLRCVAFSPDGRRLASAGVDQNVKVWDLATGRETLTLRGHRDNVASVAFSRDGNRLVTASADRTVRVWDATLLGSEVSPEVRTLRGNAGPVYAVAFHPTDGHYLVSADEAVNIWDTASGQQLDTLPGQSCRLAFSRDGRYLAAGGKPVRVWDFATRKEISAFTGTTPSVLSVAFHPDGRHLASTGFDRVVHISEVATGQQVRELHDHNWPIQSLAFHPAGQLLASGSIDSTVRVWEAVTGREVKALDRHSAAVQSVAFSPDGRYLASAGKDRTVRVWDVESWKVLRDLADPAGSVESVTFSPDGRRLAWGGRDSTVKVTAREATDMEIRTLHGHTSWVTGVSFSPDGRWIASSSLDGTVKIWTMPVGQEPPRSTAGAPPR
jgi:WD40 repeat protein/serine/threonine protein kinase